ncbi:group II intron maturase-specific domain-containing protein [Streptomyces sp. NPDC001984]
MQERLRGEVRALRDAPPLAVPRTVNPIVRGWSAYYQTVVPKEVFALGADPFEGWLSWEDADWRAGGAVVVLP